MFRFNLFMFLLLTINKGNGILSIEKWPQLLIGIMGEDSESAKDCAQFHVFGTFAIVL